MRFAWVLGVAFLSGCMAGPASPATTAPEMAPPTTSAAEPELNSTAPLVVDDDPTAGLFEWNVTRPIEYPVALRINIPAPGSGNETECNYVVQATDAHSNAAQQSAMVIIEQQGRIELYENGGLSYLDAGAHAGPIDTRPTMLSARELVPVRNAIGAGGTYPLSVGDEGASATVVAPFGPPGGNEPDFLSVAIECARETEFSLEASRAVFYHNRATMPGGAGVHAGLAGVQVDGGVDARFSSPNVRFYGRASWLAEGTIVLEGPDGVNSWSFSSLPAAPTYFNASGPAGDYRLNATWAGPFADVVTALVGFQPVATFDEFDALPALEIPD